MTTRRTAKQYCIERDAVLRKLDVDVLEKHMRKWDVRRPDEWIGDAPMIMMHKCRLQITTFTTIEKADSRKWLTDRGYSADAN